MVSCKDIPKSSKIHPFNAGFQTFTLIHLCVAAHMFRLMGVGRLGSIGLWLLILMLCIRQLTRHFSAFTPSTSEHERLLEGRAGDCWLQTEFANWKSKAKLWNSSHYIL